MSAFHYAGRTHLEQLPVRRIMSVVVLEKLEAAVDHCRINVGFKCGTRYFEQDDERVRLVTVQFRVRDERLEDVIADMQLPPHIRDWSNVR
jgi:hypothetical protein